MPSDLEIHPASPDEVVAAHRNVFDIWSKGLPLDDHLRHRLASPSHRRATWFVGCVDGRVIVSLGCYPLTFEIEGEALPGIAIGSLYTLDEFRGRGFAPRLLAWVEDYCRRRQASLSILYSDIEPDYYARLGYALCPSHSGWHELAGEPRVADEAMHFVPISAESHLPALMKLYAEYHGAMPLSIARDEEYWSAMLKKFPDDQFFALESRERKWAGYVRLWNKGDAWRITDFALENQTEGLAEHFYGALIALAGAGGAKRVGGWMPESRVASQYFKLAPRKTEITMIKPLAWQGTLTPAMIAATSRFCEIDHV